MYEHGASISQKKTTVEMMAFNKSKEDWGRVVLVWVSYSSKGWEWIFANPSNHFLCCEETLICFFGFDFGVLLINDEKLRRELHERK